MTPIPPSIRAAFYALHLTVGAARIHIEASYLALAAEPWTRPARQMLQQCYHAALSYRTRRSTR